MKSTCFCAGALALAAFYSVTAAAAPAPPPFTKAQIAAQLFRCERLARVHGPGVSVIKVGTGERSYWATAVNLGPSQGQDNLLLEEIENGSTSRRLPEKPIFTLVCLNGKVANTTDGTILLYPDGPKELFVQERLMPSLVKSRWYPQPLKSICVTKANGGPQAWPCWPWDDLPPRPTPKILSFTLPRESSGTTYDYLLHVNYLGMDIPVDPQIINH